jgi:hypothetical protein
MTIKISPELLKQLGEWSPPVQFMVQQEGGEYTLVARTHTCDPKEKQ